VADRVVRRVAQRAATEALPDCDVKSASATVANRGTRAAVSIDIAIPYQAELDQCGRHVQQCVRERTATLTGLNMSQTRVHVSVLTMPRRTRPLDAQLADETADAPQSSISGRTRRTWSERRLPSALVALAGALACALLLHDFVFLRFEGRTQSPWRSVLLRWLSTHGPGDYTLALGTAMAFLGIGMVLLAVLPGQRRQLAMRPEAGGVRPTLDQAAAEQMMHQAVMNVPGVSQVRVRLRRRRARVKAVVKFGDPEAVHRAAVTAANRTLTAYGLGRSPRLRLRLANGFGVQTAAPRPARHRSHKSAARAGRGPS